MCPPPCCRVFQHPTFPAASAGAASPRALSRAVGTVRSFALHLSPPPDRSTGALRTGRNSGMLSHPSRLRASRMPAARHGQPARMLNCVRRYERNAMEARSNRASTSSSVNALNSLSVSPFAGLAVAVAIFQGTGLGIGPAARRCKKGRFCLESARRKSQAQDVAAFPIHYKSVDTK